MSDYIQVVDFAVKDELAADDPRRIIRGSEFDQEFNAISQAIQTKTEVLPDVIQVPLNRNESSEFPTAGVDIVVDLEIASDSITLSFDYKKVLVDLHYGMIATLIQEDNQGELKRYVVDCVLTNNQTGSSVVYGDSIKYESAKTINNVSGTHVDVRRSPQNYTFYSLQSPSELVGTSDSGYTFTCKVSTDGFPFGLKNIDHIEYEASILLRETD